MSTAVRVGVDLNSRCSRKCAAPATLEPSSRDPTPTQTPTDAECTDGMYSVTTRRPPGSVVRRTAADVSSLRWPRRKALTAGRCGIGRRRHVLCCLCLCAFVFGYEDQRDLAAVVDVGDLHTQLVTDVDHILDLGDALAPAELGDVDQPVTARQQRHERAEIGCLDDGSEESLTYLGQLRVGDRVDHVDRGLRRLAIGRTDEHRAVVLDGDGSTGLLGYRVDHLALRPDHLADLVHGDLDGGDPRRV